MSAKVTDTQRAKWRPVGFAAHFCSREKCQFHLATVIEETYVVSSVGHWTPNNDGKAEPIGGGDPAVDAPFYETYVFAIAHFTSTGFPFIGPLKYADRYREVQDAEKGHVALCEKVQRLLNRRKKKK